MCIVRVWLCIVYVVRCCACGKTLKTRGNREKCVWYGVCVVWCCEVRNTQKHDKHWENSQNMVSFFGTVWPSKDRKKVQNWSFSPTHCFYVSPGICRRFWPEVLTRTPKNAVFRPRSYSKGPNHALEKVLTKETPSICTYSPKDRKCDICLRTKITRVPCRKRTGTVVPRAEIFGDLITADHKVRNEGSESAVRCRGTRSRHSGIQSYPCKNKTKTSQQTEKSLRNFPEPTQKPKVIYTDNSFEFGKSCEEVSWNHRTATTHRSESSGIAERAVRRAKKENTSCITAIWIG